MTLNLCLYMVWMHVAAMLGAAMTTRGNSGWIKEAVDDPQYATIPRWLKVSTMYITVLIVLIGWPAIALWAIREMRK